MGSCFAENIGDKLLKLKINASINPLGIAYNPVSIADLLTTDINEFLKTRNTNHGLYFNYLLHSEFNNTNQKEFESKLRNQFETLNTAVLDSKHVFISLGTAWIYQLKENGLIVNNCHKQPSDLFNKELLSVDDTIVALHRIMDKLPDHQVTFTVSPIRHLRDGFRDNTLSKSILHLATEKICQTYSNATYFPSYELMMDDLRDYRFYEPDMLHPNDQGIEYIWEFFKQSFFTEESRTQVESRIKLLQSVHHKAFQSHSDQHQKFLKKLKRKLEEHGTLFQEEIKLVNDQLLP